MKNDVYLNSIETMTVKKKEQKKLRNLHTGFQSEKQEAIIIREKPSEAIDQIFD